MTHPIASPEELEEISNLEAEAEQPGKRLALIAELVRLRSLASVCRKHTGRLPRQVQLVLDTKVPKRNQTAEWARHVAESVDIEDPRLQGAPRLI